MMQPRDYRETGQAISDNLSIYVQKALFCLLSPSLVIFAAITGYEIMRRM